MSRFFYKTINEANRSSEELISCLAWVRTFCEHEELPTKDQFEILQDAGFLPTHAEFHGSTDEVRYGHYGWAVAYPWKVIAVKILATTTSMLAR